jgi:cytochrome P450
VTLLPQTEVVISPFVEHRCAKVFRDPDRLWPERWTDAQPGAFEYLPFGGGVRSCLGKSIALQTLERAAGALLGMFDIFLPRPQRLDWTMNTTLQPATEPVVRFARRGPHYADRHELSGPAAELLWAATNP